MPLPALAALAAAPAVIQGISGLFGIARGKKMARNNPFPNQAVNQNLIQNAAMADNMARVGTPSQQYNNQLQDIQKNQTGGVRILSRSSNPIAGVSGLVRASNEAIGGLNARDAMDRVNNQRLAMQQRGILAGEENRVWDWNKKTRYLQNAQAAAETIGAGRQNLFGGLQSLSQVGQLAMMGEDGGMGGGQSDFNQLDRSTYSFRDRLLGTRTPTGYTGQLRPMTMNGGRIV